MRKAAVILFSMLIASAAIAQQKKNDFSVFVTDAGFGWSSGRGTTASASYGIAFDRMLTQQFSAQLAIGSEGHRTYSYIVNPTGTFQAVDPVHFRTYPIDLAVRYQFLDESRWKPYVGLGARYVAAPNVSSDFRYKNHIGPEIVGGTSFQIRRSFGLVLDGKLYLGDHEQYDSNFKPSFGLLWRF